MGAPYHGKNGLIYISGLNLVGGNAWAIDIPTDSVETPQFGDGWKKRVVGMNDWSGTINAWDQGDEKILATMATARKGVTLLLYPDRSDVSNYYTGNAIFGASTGGGVSAAVNRNGSFVGNGTLTIAGFS